MRELWKCNGRRFGLDIYGISIKIWDKILTALPILFEAIVCVINGKWDKNCLILGESSTVSSKHILFESQAVEMTQCSPSLQALSRFGPNTECIKVRWVLWAERMSLFLSLSKYRNCLPAFPCEAAPSLPALGLAASAHPPCGSLPLSGEPSRLGQIHSQLQYV